MTRLRKDQRRIGTRKLYAMLSDFLAQSEIKIGRDAFFALLKEHSMLIRPRKKKTVTTLSKHRFKKYPNIIREFCPQKPNELWVSDITYINLDNRFAFLSLITDAYSRKIVGYRLCKNLSTEGPLRALKMALVNESPKSRIIHHSDRGVQYCCFEYVKLLTSKGVTISMTENGDPLENALAERVNGILKTELLASRYSSFSIAENEITKAIHIYNNLRIHGSINNFTPAKAHKLSGHLPRLWKNYYQIRAKRKEDDMKN